MELFALVKAGKIKKVNRGVYRWSTEASLIDEVYSFSSLCQSLERDLRVSHSRQMQGAILLGIVFVPVLEFYQIVDPSGIFHSL